MVTLGSLSSSITLGSTLENGDRLSREEFEQRYTASEVKKAELIEGIVYVASPLRFMPHGKPHSNIVTWLGTYQALSANLGAGLEVGIEPTVRLASDNELQPDVVLFRIGGNATIDADGYITGVPELIAEIAASTASYDLHAKKRIYEKNGVKEYIVWRTLDQQIDWFVCENGAYFQAQPDASGIIRSREFAGLWLDMAALLRHDMATVLRVLQMGLNSCK